MSYVQDQNSTALKKKQREKQVRADSYQLNF